MDSGSPADAARAGMLAAEVIQELCSRLESKEAELDSATGLLEEQAAAWEARDEEVRRECASAAAQLAAAQELCARTLAGAEANAARVGVLERQLAGVLERLAQAEGQGVLGVPS